MAKQTVEEKGLVTVNQFAALAVGNDFAEVVAANIGSGGIAPFDLDRVKVPAGGGTQWTVTSLAGEEQVSEIDGVIVSWRRVRSYWRESFAETGGGTPPDCSSDDGIIGVGEPGGECSRCPLSKWGSAGNGRAQACSETKMLFLIREGDRLPIVISVPPSSLGPVSKYFLRLLSHGAPYYGVLTRLTLDRTKNKDGIAYSQIQPSMVSTLSPEECAKIKSYALGLQPLFAAAAANVEEF
jgi:hypothetical protein